MITQFCLASNSKNPMEMAMTIMKHPVIPMHGPEHHAMIAAVLVTAYKNLTGKATNEDIKKLFAEALPFLAVTVVFSELMGQQLPQGSLFQRS
jgi:hemoglobin-like flavoprotein